MARRNWSREETLMAFTLYCMLPEREIDKKGKDIIALANVLDRTPDAVALKAWNIAANDKNHVASGRVGMPHGSKLDNLIWEEFAERGDALLEEGLNLLCETIPYDSMSSAVSYCIVKLTPEGKERTSLRSERVNQQYFRNRLLENYEGKCCVTGLDKPELLMASHIKPWNSADPKTERLVASNGLLLNALHDKAFDKGLITLDKNHRIVLSTKLSGNDPATSFLRQTEGQKIREPLAMAPAQNFIEYHNDMVFIA